MTFFFPKTQGFFIYHCTNAFARNFRVLETIFALSTIWGNMGKLLLLNLRSPLKWASQLFASQRYNEVWLVNTWESEEKRLHINVLKYYYIGFQKTEIWGIWYRLKWKIRGNSSALGLLSGSRDKAQASYCYSPKFQTDLKRKSGGRNVWSALCDTLVYN